MRVRQAALLSGLLCATCDQPSAKSVVCGPDEILRMDHDRQLTCVLAPQGPIVSPVCAEALTSDGTKLTCTSAVTSADTDTDIDAILKQLDAVALSIPALLKRPAPIAHYVGVSTQITGGLFLYKNMRGTRAATGSCSEQYGAGAHLCAMDELYQSVVDGTLGATSTLPSSWAYVPNWYRPNPLGLAEPEAGLADNCGGYTSPMQSTKWRGILVEWGPLPDGSPGFRWRGGDSASCSTQRPIACCK